MNSVPVSSSVVPFIRKITPKAIAELKGINLLALPRPVRPQTLYDLFGTVFAATVKEDKTGVKPASVQFKGEFQAADPETGEALADSGVFFIPVMDSVLYTALKNAQDMDPKARIAVALRVSIKTAPADKPSMTGYEFDVQRLIPTVEHKDDPIARLKAMAKEHAARPALEAPKKARDGKGG